MKKRVQLFMVTAIIAAGFVGCSNEEVAGPNVGPEIKEGGETFSSLVVKDATPGTYGTTETEAPGPTEGLINASNLTAFVFEGDNGAPANVSYVSPAIEMVFTGTGPYVSDPFKISTGEKYFYVLADQNGAPLGLEQKSSRGAYERQTVSAGFEVSIENVAGSTTVQRVKPLPKNLAEPEEFLMGTLWGGKKTAVTDVKPEHSDPLRITGLSIGRLAAKVNLTSVTDGGKFTLGGQFNKNGNATYRLCSVPDAMFLVGQWDGTDEPGTNAASPLVKSLYHDEPYGTGHGVQNDKFKNYQWDGAYALNAPYYTVENTSAKQADPVIVGSTAKQYYGNTTYIQLKIHYTPDPTSVHKADGTPGGSIDVDGTFWVYYVHGEPWIFGTSASESIPGIDKDSGVEYKEGFMYYAFPIRDNSEKDDPVKRNAVLRNHSYSVKVTEIKRFGAGEPAEVTPETPIEEDTWVTLEVSVLPWSKIGQDVPL